MWAVPTERPLGRRPGEELRSTNTPSRHHKAALAVLYPGESLQPIQDTNHVH